MYNRGFTHILKLILITQGGDYHIQKETTMNTIVYVGMDVHKESYTLCCYSYDTDKVEYKQTIPSDYKLIFK